MNLVLIGLMGTGKSTLGQLLAQELQYRFLDTDHVIEARQGRSISEIFGQEGEAFFRNLERELAEELATGERMVIATGGGFPLNAANIQVLRPKSLIVALTADPETIYQRIKDETQRPLLAQTDPLQRIVALAEARLQIYQNADLTLDTTRYSVAEMSAQIIAEFNKRGNRHGENQA